jgi:phage gpG-like protein
MADEIGKVTIDTAVLDRMIATQPAKFLELVKKTAFEVIKSAREIAPRDPNRPPKDPERQVTGTLKANSDMVETGSLSVNVEFYQEYAPYQELGAPAINLPARPFLTPSVEKHAQELIDDITKAVNNP